MMRFISCALTLFGTPLRGKALKSFGHVVFLIVLMAGIVLSSASYAQELEPIAAIDVTGNHRVETPTIMSYIDIKPGDRASEGKIEEVLKNLFATGLFADVFIEQIGNRLSIKVVENKIIKLGCYIGRKIR